MDKQERYDWEPLGKPWPRRLVLLRLLNVDKSYQRENLNIVKARAIAKRWDFAAAGDLVVCERADGSLWIIDGRHRKEGALLRGDIDRLSAIIVKLATVEEEAALFQLLNNGRSNVASVDFYKASVTAGDQLYFACNTVIEAMGLRVRRGHTADTIRFPKSLVNTFSKDADACADALRIQRTMIGPDRQLSEHIHIGLFHIIKKHGAPAVAERAGGVFANGGRDAVENEIKRVKLLQGFGSPGHSTDACISGVLAALNRRRHTKLTME